MSMMAEDSQSFWSVWVWNQEAGHDVWSDYNWTSSDKTLWMTLRLHNSTFQTGYLEYYPWGMELGHFLIKVTQTFFHAGHFNVFVPLELQGTYKKHCGTIRYYDKDYLRVLRTSTMTEK